MSPRVAGPIAVLAALEVEAAALTSRLEPSRRSASPVALWEGRLNGVDVAVALTGVGKVAAAMGAQLSCDVLRPRCLLSVGVAGAARDSYGRGAVCIVESAVQHDMDARPLTVERGVIPGFDAAELEADAAIVTTLLEVARTELGEGRTVGRGLALTGDQVIASRETRDALAARFPSAACVDMETAAVAQVAIRNGVPWAGLRMTSDLADEAFDLEEVLGFAQAASVAIALVLQAAAPKL